MTRKEQFYKVYQAWGDMKYKCNNPNCKVYRKFGGSGITYAKAWEDYDNFRADMLPGYLKLIEAGVPSKKITLGRIDPSKEFTKENCKWMSPFEQTIALNPQQLNFIVAMGTDNIKRVFPSLKSMANYFNFSRTGASNALKRKTYCIKNVVFNPISRENYEKALMDPKFLNNLEITYNKETFKRNIAKIIAALTSTEK